MNPASARKPPTRLGTIPELQGGQMTPDTTRAPQSDGISRRAFARRAALVAATAVLPPGSARAQTGAPRTQRGAAAPPVPQRPAEAPLPPENQARADAILANIFRKYGSRFSEDQKRRLRQSAIRNERLLMKVRSFPLANGDPPAEVLRLNRGDAC